MSLKRTLRLARAWRDYDIGEAPQREPSNVVEAYYQEGSKKLRDRMRFHLYGTEDRHGHHE